MHIKLCKDEIEIKATTQQTQQKLDLTDTAINEMLSVVSLMMLFMKNAWIERFRFMSSSLDFDFEK